MIAVIVPKCYTESLRKVVAKSIVDKSNGKISLFDIRFLDGLIHGCTKVGPKKKGVYTTVADRGKTSLFFAALDRFIDRMKPSALGLSCPIALEFLSSGTFCSVFSTRGSVYSYRGIPIVVLFQLRTTEGFVVLHAEAYNKLILGYDCEKLAAMALKRPNPQLNLVEIRICKTRQDLLDLLSAAQAADYIACDVETTGRGRFARISVFGYCTVSGTSAVSWVVSPYNPSNDDKLLFSSDADLEFLFSILRDINDTLPPKVMHNGSYDAAYYIQAGLPLRNWFLDTHVMWHSVFVEMPKRLAFIASLLCHKYRFWKDESAVEESSKDDLKTNKIPQTPDGWFRYLRYNGLDTYYTACILPPLLSVLSRKTWAKTNYIRSMTQVLGPALAMSMRGIRVNRDIHTAVCQDKEQQSKNALARIRDVLGDSEFLPNSPDQVAKYVYDFLGARPINPKKPRDTGEKSLALLRPQHFLLRRFTDMLWAYKKPTKFLADFNENKFGFHPVSPRWMYQLKAAGTETERYSSSEHNFWQGVQIQNPPYGIREIVEPDPGYVFFNIDYSKADFWHTAFASGEPKMIAACQNESLDLHCYHASIFFSRPYDEIFAGYKAKEFWVVDSIHGIRQNAKRIVYGANYLMAGATLFLTMGFDATKATAEAMGQNTQTWQIKEYTDFCQRLLDMYFNVLYPNLRGWLNTELGRSATNGNLATLWAGRTRMFMGDLLKDRATQREFAAFWGQGGTACMINNAMAQIYWGGLDSQDSMLLLMMHDSIGGQVRETKLDLIDRFADTMQQQMTFRGRSFCVPVEAEVGYGWGHRMTTYKPGISLEEIKLADTKWKQKQQYQNPTHPLPHPFSRGNGHV